MKPKSIDFAALACAVKSRREERNLSLRDVGKLTGVGHARLCGLENGRRLGIDHVRRLCVWLNTPLERFTEGGVSFKDEPTPDKIDACIFSDRTLRPEARATLSRLMRTAYAAFAGPSR